MQYLCGSKRKDKAMNIQDHTSAGDLTKGSITGTMLRFAIPMMLGNLLQQCYNIADTLIVGHFLGADALAAVGSAYSLMVFITSIFIGLCMGTGAVFSLQYGAKDYEGMKRSLVSSLLLTGGITLIINTLSLIFVHPIIRWLQTPAEITGMMHDYLLVIFIGIFSTFLYNYYAFLLRALGNSIVPLAFLGISVVLNIVLDLVFIAIFHWGVTGAAVATVISQIVSGVGLCLYTLYRFPIFRLKWKHIRINRQSIREIATYSSLTCMQQSVMNFGILMVQGLVNSFGTAVMAAFAIAVKIDTFAYMPVQDFGNAFSTFIAQNFGAKKFERIKKGIHNTLWFITGFCLCISAAVFVFARPLMQLFIDANETEIIAIGVEYLRVEGSFYVGIGYLFMFYGLFRAIRMPGMSVVLTVFSLGTRVALAYGLASIPSIGVHGIWWSIPIGWALADLFGWWYYRKAASRLIPASSLS